jgi:uncharacterized membrane protein
MRLPAIDAWSVLAGAGTLAYPFVVWFGLASLPPAAFVVAGLLCMAARLIATRGQAGVAAFVVAGIALLGLLGLAPALAARAYPVAISLAVASVFAASLIRPPSVVERIARLAEPDLSPAGVAYTRGVTWVWLGFLLGNAAISVWTALFASLAVWTLWNGLLSYLAMGALFAGEFVVRRRVRA